MIQAIIIDDERKGRETLQLLLNNYCPGVQVVALADSVANARELMYLHTPDLIFLDVEMPLGNGFELLESIGDTLRFEVIFTTAYDRYAIRAIKSDALDYLLKPIDCDELVAAVEKAEKKLAEKKAADIDLELLLRNIRETADERATIPLSTSRGIIMVPLGDIIRCSAETNYTRFHLCNGSEILVARTLKEFEVALAAKGFVRIHHSHLVNLKHITRYIRGEGGQVVMSDGVTVMVSRRRKEELMRRLAR